MLMGATSNEIWVINVNVTSLGKFLRLTYLSIRFVTSLGRPSQDSQAGVYVHFQCHFVLWYLSELDSNVLIIIIFFC